MGMWRQRCGSSGGNTYSRSLAEIQNHHNDSQEQLSPPPGPRSKHDEAYSVDEPYEICPYATFSMPPGSNVPPGSAGRGTLDYTLQFHTFGHQECFEGQPAPQRASAASLLGGRRRDGGCGSAAGASVEIACISSQQTLPISCVRAGGRRGGKKEVEEVEEGEVHGGSESEQDTSGSPGGVRGVPRDTYKVPVRLRRGELKNSCYHTLTAHSGPFQ
ncbi:hypothetical protein GWK47_002355 [Chionoecetes opilio]|uniref:Uncharacterized protein n=1 Tax=Chionoecetes opilio TaxID=41210 RepID=A0A8J4XPQ5_CHIOP|nr:hypothetical protein GWK47_002355 [Chionoecetes opilio]